MKQTGELPGNALPGIEPIGLATEPLDASLVRALAEVLDDFNLTEIEVSQRDLRLRIARQGSGVAAAPPAPAAPAPVMQATAAPAGAATAGPAAEHPGTVKSPMVGTVYRRPNPEARPFVEIGSQVKPGDKILLIEAMKTFNDILAPRAGTITEIFIDDNQPVEYGEPLLVIE